MKNFNANCKVAILSLYFCKQNIKKNTIFVTFLYFYMSPNAIKYKLHENNSTEKTYLEFENIIIISI